MSNFKRYKCHFLDVSEVTILIQNKSLSDPTQHWVLRFSKGYYLWQTCTTKLHLKKNVFINIINKTKLKCFTFVLT